MLYWCEINVRAPKRSWNLFYFEWQWQSCLHFTILILSSLIVCLYFLLFLVYVNINNKEDIYKIYKHSYWLMTNKYITWPDIIHILTLILQKLSGSPNRQGLYEISLLIISIKKCFPQFSKSFCRRVSYLLYRVFHLPSRKGFRSFSKRYGNPEKNVNF